MKLRSSVAILCLGHGLLSKSTLSNTLIGRLSGVLDLLRALASVQAPNLSHAQPFHLILSGGDARGLGVTEAQAMKQYIDSNVALSRTLNQSCSIILEDNSTNTIENIVYSMPYLNSLDCSVVHIVTSEYHLPRAMLCAKSILPISITCKGHATRSGHSLNPLYRPLKDRPKDANSWNLCEILDWEVSGVNRLQQELQKRNLHCRASASDIAQALEELRVLNKTYGTPYGAG